MINIFQQQKYYVGEPYSTWKKKKQNKTNKHTIIKHLFIFKKEALKIRKKNNFIKILKALYKKIQHKFIKFAFFIDMIDSAQM